MEKEIREIIRKELNAEVLSIKPTSGGFSHKMYELEIDKSPYNLLIRFSNNSTYKDEDLQKELYVLERLSEIGIPVPKIYAFKKSNTEESHDYMLLEKLKGVRLDTIWENLKIEEKKDITKEIGTMMKKIHTIKLEKFGRLKAEGKIEPDSGFKFNSDKESLTYNSHVRQLLRGFFKDVARLTAYNHVDKRVIKDILSHIFEKFELINYQGSPVLIHGDMHIGHIFVQKKDKSWEITGVIDVEFAEPSEPEYDFIKLHRQGFFDNLDLKNSLIEGYGKIEEQKVEIYRIMRDVGFTQILYESGDKELGDKTLKNIIDRIKSS